VIDSFGPEIQELSSNSNGILEGVATRRVLSQEIGAAHFNFSNSVTARD
jgi:hypothetical protein